MWLFSCPALANYHKLGCLKPQKCLHSSGDWKSEIRVSAGLASSKGFKGEPGRTSPSFWWWLTILGVPWLVDVPLQCLSPSLIISQVKKTNTSQSQRSPPLPSSPSRAQLLQPTWGIFSWLLCISYCFTFVGISKQESFLSFIFKLYISEIINTYLSMTCFFHSTLCLWK